MRTVLLTLFIYLLLGIQIKAQPTICPVEDADMTPTCIEACIICDIDGYTGTHESNVNGVLPNDFCTFFVHNAQWIGFQAASTDLTIQLTVSNCDRGIGLEMAIYESVDCVNFEMVSNCLGGMGGIVGEGETGIFQNNVPLVVGQYYYLAMDGGMGDNCDWTLNVLEGSTELDPLDIAPEILGQDYLCIGQNVDFTIHNVFGATSYQWELDGVLVSQGKDTSFTFQPVLTGEYELCTVASNICSTSPPHCITIHVGTASIIEVKDSICDGFGYVFFADTLFSSGIYPITTTSITGCDSTIILELTVLKNSIDTFYSSICEGDTILTTFGTILSEGNYRDTLKNTFGCDSIILYVIEQNKNFVDSIHIALCEGDSLTTNQHNIFTSGIYIDTLSTIHQCDSLLIYDVFFHPNSYDSIEIRACFGQKIVIDGFNFMQDTTYISRLSSIFSCDSILVYSLKFHDVFRDTVKLTLCEGEEFKLKDSIINTTGIYTDSLFTSNMCDSIIFYHINFLKQSVDTLFVEFCEGESFTVSNLIIDTFGIFTDTVINVLGCDSVLTIIASKKQCAIDVHVHFVHPSCHNSSTGFIGISLSYALLPINCQLGTLDGLVLKSFDVNSLKDTLFFDSLMAGTYTLTISDQNNKNYQDTIILTQPEPIKISSSTLSDFNGYGISCNGYNDGLIEIEISGGIPTYAVTWSNGSTENLVSNLTKGNYNVLIRDSIGCLHSETFILQEPETLTHNIFISQKPCDDYQAINEFKINGGTQPYTIQLNDETLLDNITSKQLNEGQYTIYITDANGCITSEVFEINETFDCEIYTPNIISANENSSNKYFGVFVSTKFRGSFQSLKIYDRWGSMVFNVNNFIPSAYLWDGTFKGKPVEQGVYTYIIEYSIESLGKQIKSGDVTVIR